MKIDYGFFKISSWSQVPQGLCSESLVSSAIFFNEKELKDLVWHQMLCKYCLIINLQLPTNP